MEGKKWKEWKAVCEISGRLKVKEMEECLWNLQKLRQLESEGYQGKSLIDTLISDDWGAPPRGVLLKGILSNGQKIDENIRYD